MAIKWPQLKELAPIGKIMIDNQIVPVETLIREDYPSLTTEKINFARDMVIEEVQYVHYFDGDFQKNTLYNVYFNPRETHCLSVYGAKMLRDYLENTSSEPIYKEGEEDEVRFNYTGLQ